MYAPSFHMNGTGNVKQKNSALELKARKSTTLTQNSKFFTTYSTDGLKLKENLQAYI